MMAVVGIRCELNIAWTVLHLLALCFLVSKCSLRRNMAAVGPMLKWSSPESVRSQRRNWLNDSATPRIDYIFPFDNISRISRPISVEKLEKTIYISEFASPRQRMRSRVRKHKVRHGPKWRNYIERRGEVNFISKRYHHRSDRKLNRIKWNAVPSNRVTPKLKYPSKFLLDPDLTKVRTRIVRLHNHYRTKVNPSAANMLAVKWYFSAAEQALTWAEQCRYDSQREQPSERWTQRFGTCGQNVAISKFRKSWGKIIRGWWSERKHFKYGSPGNNVTYSGSYTQIVWYNSHKVGCGYAECSTSHGESFYRYVCNYCPTGNDPSMISYPYKKGRPCSSCTHACRFVCSRGTCKMCTNSCEYADLWLNCTSLKKQWENWLCKTKTLSGVQRYKNCRATCECSNKLT